MARFTFYTNPQSRGRVARWALHEVAADYTAVIVDWQNRPEAFLAANPMGKVPTLIDHASDGDHVITESAAICHYLAVTHPEAELLPHPKETADYFRWLFFAAGPIEAAITSVALGFEPEGRQQMLAGWGTRDLTVAAIDAHLATHAFVCGTRFTMADVYVGSALAFGTRFKSLPMTPHFEAYIERIHARTAFASASAIDDAPVTAS